MNIDDCWSSWDRTAEGKLVANTTRFPSGMKAPSPSPPPSNANPLTLTRSLILTLILTLTLTLMKALADYVHRKGLKLGTYNDMGTATCGKYPGECKVG